MKYQAIKRSLPTKIINASGKVVALADKGITETIKPSALYPDGVRDIPAANQSDLKYAYEVLGLRHLIDVVEDLPASDLSKNDKK